DVDIVLYIEIPTRNTEIIRLRLHPSLPPDHSAQSAHDDLIAGLDLNVLLQVLPGDDFFVIELEPGAAPPHDNHILLIGKLPESACVANGFEHGCRHQQ